MWLWAAFIVFILFLLTLDLGVFHRKAHAITLKEALLLSSLWISVALAFNVFIYFAYEHHWFGLDLPEHDPDGRTAAVLFLTGYVVEKSLGRIPPLYQHRVLFWGVAGALVMRAVMIFAGVALINRFDWILYLFGVFLIVSGVKMALVLIVNRNSGNMFVGSNTWTPSGDAMTSRMADFGRGAAPDES
jgi:tellurite resistance protein TerC